MEDIQEGSKRVASHITNLSLVHKRLIEQVGCVLLLDLLLLLFFFSLLLTLFTILFLDSLLLLHRTRDIKPHLNQLIRARSSLLATVLCAARLATRSIWLIIPKRKLDGDFVLSGKVRIRDFGVGDLEGRSVLHVERKLGLCEVGFTPVPPSQGMFAGLDIDAIPDFERFAQSFKVLAMVSS